MAEGRDLEWGWSGSEEVEEEEEDQEEECGRGVWWDMLFLGRENC